MTNFSVNVRTLRKHLGLTQTTFAERIKVHPINVAKYEGGALKPSYETLETIASAFKVNLGWLVSGQGQMFADAPPMDQADADMLELMEFLHMHPEQKKLLMDVMHVQKKAVEGMDSVAKPSRHLKPRTT